MKNYLLLLSFSIILFSCNPISKIKFAENQDFDESKTCNDLSVSSNGTASFYIKYKNSAVLTDPFMSNPSMRKVLFGEIESDTALLDSYQVKSKDIKIIALGHSHYDHILDLPYFIDKVSSETILTGSKNTLKIAETLSPNFDLIDVSNLKANSEKMGTWVYSKDKSVRVLAIKSAHLPHLFGIHFYEGAYNKDSLTHYPIKANDFKQDETLAYLIDFLDENLKPEKRIYYSSSAVAELNGLVPSEILKEKEVDLAILSLGKVQEAKGFPENIVDYFKPKEVILCHWENFFRDRKKSLKPIGLTNFRKIFKSVETLEKETNVHFVKPGHSMIFP